MAVGLEEGSGADAVGGLLRLVGQVGRSESDQNLLRTFLPVARIGFAENNDSCDFGQGGAQFLGPGTHGGAAGLAGATDVHQQLGVVGVGEEFDFAHSLGNPPASPALPERGETTVDQRRADWTLLDREQFVRSELEVSGGELWMRLDLKTGAVAIIPRRRGMNFDLAGEFELREAAQGLTQDLFLDLKLMLVGRLLVVTSAAVGKIWTGRRDAVRRRLDDRLGLGSREAGLTLANRSFDFFSGEDEWDEDGLAASAVGGGRRVGGQTS